MDLIDIVIASVQSNVLGSAVNKSWQHQEECQESNLRQLGAKQECYQFCYAVPQFNI